MVQKEQVGEIYTQLPIVAQQEALDFLLFLQQRYGVDKPAASQVGTDDAPVRSIRDNPAFGMWSDVQGDSRKFLNQIRQKEWMRS